MQPEAVLHGDAEPGQQRASESAEALLRRNGLVAMMQEIRLLALQLLVMGNIRHVADVVVGPDEDKVVRPGEKLADGGHFGGAGRLTRSKRIEADHDQRIGRGEDGIVQRVCRPSSATRARSQ